MFVGKLGVTVIVYVPFRACPGGVIVYFLIGGSRTILHVLACSTALDFRVELTTRTSVLEGARPSMHVGNSALEAYSYSPSVIFGASDEDCLRLYRVPSGQRNGYLMAGALEQPPSPPHNLGSMSATTAEIAAATRMIERMVVLVLTKSYSGRML